jgi:NAD(P)-dependent dehydrogenase (short-subunit alcohol dehydrogenase family)
MRNGIVFGASGLLGPVWVKALALKSDKVYCVGLGVKKDPELLEFSKDNPEKCILIEQDLTEPIEGIEYTKFDFGIFSAATDSVPNESARYGFSEFPLHSWEPFLNNQKMFVNSLDFFCNNRSKESYGVVIGSMYTSSIPRLSNYVDAVNEVKFVKHPGYSSSKVAIKNIMQQYAANFASSSLVLNMLSPGVVLNNHPAWFVKNIKAHIPAEKFVDKFDLIAPIDFLTSIGAKYLIGQELLLDGGYSLW